MRLKLILFNTELCNYGPFKSDLHLCNCRLESPRPQATAARNLRALKVCRLDFSSRS